MSWPDYKMIVEISGDRGWTTHLFDNDWSDNIWPRSYIQGLVDNFIQRHEPPTRGMGKVALYKVDAERIEPSGWKVDAQPPGSWKRPNGIYKTALPDNVILIRIFSSGSDTTALILSYHPCPASRS